eukprot:1582491-Rhodomonas_salina.4
MTSNSHTLSCGWCVRPGLSSDGASRALIPRLRWAVTSWPLVPSSVRPACPMPQSGHRRATL